MKNIIALVLMLCLGYLGFSYMFGSSAPENTAPIKIGTIMSETGVAGAFGEMSLKGAELAVEEINKNGGVDGRQVVIISDDDRSDPKTAAGLYKKQTSLDKVDAIIGSNFDFTVGPIFELAKNGNTAVITPTASRIAGSLETNKESFSMLVDFERIVAGLSKYMNDAPYKKLGVIHYASGFGEQINTTLAGIAKSQGKTTTEETYNAFGTTDWKPIILKFKKEGIDLVFLDMLADDMLRFVKDAKTIGYSPIIMTHNDIRNALTKKETNTSLLENVVVLNWDVLETEKFRSDFITKWGTEPLNYAAQSYAAVYMITEAVRKNSRETLSETLGVRPLKTPFGTMSFDRNHSIREMPIKVQVIKNGKLIELYSL